MQAEHLTEAEIGEMLAGATGIPTEHLATCRQCSGDLAALAALRDGLRSGLQRAAENPEHFWNRQRARIRARIAERTTPLRWPAAAMAALALLSFALVSIHTAPPRAHQAQGADADDLLLKDIQHSLARRAPEPLMPASVLVQEITTNSKNDQKRDN